MKRILGIFFSVLVLGLYGEQLLTLSFDKAGTLNYLKKTVKANNYNKNIYPESKDGLIFAHYNLNEFKTKSNAVLDKAVKVMKFNSNFTFPQTGYVDVVVKPYFNDKRKKNPHNYIYSFYSNNKKQPDSLRLFLLNSNTIVAQFFFSNNAKSFLYYTNFKMAAKKELKIGVAWNENTQKLYVNNKLVASKNKVGKLTQIAGLEVGSMYGNHSLQGIISKLELHSGEIPLKEDFDGNLSKYPNIVLPENFLAKDAWTNPTKAIKLSNNNKALKFSYDGSSFDGASTFSKAFNVEPNSYIKGNLLFKKLKWDFGSDMVFYLNFYNPNNQLVLQKRFDSSNIPGYTSMTLSEQHSVIAQNIPISYFNYYKVPNNAVKAKVELSLKRNASIIEISNISFRKVDPTLKSWRTQPVLPSKLYKHIKIKTSEKEIDKIISSRARLNLRRVKIGNRVTIKNGSKEVNPVIYHTNNYKPGTPLEYYPSMDKAGFEIKDIWVSMGKFRASQHEALMEDGSIDVSSWQKAVRKVISQSPNSIVFLSINIFPNLKWLMDRPQLWMGSRDDVPFIYGYPYYPVGKNPNRVLPKGYNRIPSMFSNEFISYITGKFKEALIAFEKTPESKVVGGIYIVGFDDAQFRTPGIHFTPDNSFEARKAYKQYLMDKYKTNSALQKAWKKSNVTFNNVKFPTKEELWVDDYYHKVGEITPEVDYKIFYVSGERKFKNALRKTAKSAVPRLLVGNYDCTYGAIGSWGHTGFSFRSTLDDMADFSIWLPNYGRDRDGDGMALTIYQYPGSLLLRNKFTIMEHDYRHPDMPKLYFGQYTSRNWQSTHNSKSFQNALNYATSLTAALGGGYHFYTLQNSWIKPANSIDIVGNARKIFSHVSKDDSLDYIAILLDDDSHFYNSIHPKWIPAFMNMRGQPQKSAQHSGVGFNIFEAHDALHKNFIAPKVLFFADSGTLTPNEILKIRSKWGKDNRVIVWCGSPSFLTTKDNLAITKALGTKLVLQPTSFTPMLKVDTKIVDPIISNVKGYLVSWISKDPYLAPPRWEIVDKNAKALAFYEGTQKCALAVKRHQNFTEVFIGQPGMVSPQLLRNIAKVAGIKVVSNTDNLVTVGAGLLSFTSSINSGVKKIFFPKGTKKLIPLTNHKILKATDKYIEVFIPYRDTCVFKQVF